MPDLRSPPPSRYRVVERDRRLVVIDRTTGGVADSHRPNRTSGPPAQSGLSAWLPRQTQFDGTAELTTHRFYDEKAPRTIRLDPGSAAIVGRLKLVAIGVAFAAIIVAIASPWLLLPIVLFLNGAVRTGVRKAVTGWLDRVEQEAS